MNANGTELRKLRKLAAWSLELTCDRSGVVDISRLSRYERNLVDMRPDQIAAIERALKSEIRARAARIAQVLGPQGVQGAQGARL